MSTSPGSDAAAAAGIRLEVVVDPAVVEADRDVEGALAARRHGLAGEQLVGTSHSHEGSRRRRGGR